MTGLIYFAIKFYLMIFTLIIVLYPIFYYLWYKKNYMTKEQTNLYNKGWHKCINCKKAENTMYYTNHFFGRLYKCSECAFKKK
jgi:predicted membrane protein